MTPLVIGTELAFTPAAHADGGAGGGWPENPCIEDPQSDECGYFQAWLTEQEDFWQSVFGVSYAHEQSMLTVEPTSEGEFDASQPWELTGWLDAGLDYEDPELDEQDVLDQIVGNATLDLENLGELATDTDAYVDADGMMFPFDVTLFISAGIIIDGTGRQIIEDADPNFFSDRDPDFHLPPEYLRPVPIENLAADVLTDEEFEEFVEHAHSFVATIVQVDIANEQSTYQLGIVEMTETIDGAIDHALTVFEIANGIEPILEEQIVCPPSMSDECCDCINNHPPSQAGLKACDNLYTADLLACIPWNMGAIALAITVCLLTCAKLPVACVPCWITVTPALTGLASAGCMSRAGAKWEACVTQAYGDMIDCLAENDCDYNPLPF